MAEDEVDWDDDVRDDDVVSLEGGYGDDDVAIGFSLPPINSADITNGTSIETISITDTTGTQPPTSSSSLPKLAATLSLPPGLPAKPMSSAEAAKALRLPPSHPSLTAASAMSASNALPQGWEACRSKTTGRTFYLQTDTGKTTWEKPPVQSNTRTNPVSPPPGLPERPTFTAFPTTKKRDEDRSQLRESERHWVASEDKGDGNRRRGTDRHSRKQTYTPPPSANRIVDSYIPGHSPEPQVRRRERSISRSPPPPPPPARRGGQNGEERPKARGEQRGRPRSPVAAREVPHRNYNRSRSPAPPRPVPTNRPRSPPPRTRRTRGEEGPINNNRETRSIHPDDYRPEKPQIDAPRERNDRRVPDRDIKDPLPLRRRSPSPPPQRYEAPPARSSQNQSQATVVPQKRREISRSKGRREMDSWVSERSPSPPPRPPRSEEGGDFKRRRMSPGADANSSTSRFRPVHSREPSLNGDRDRIRDDDRDIERSKNGSEGQIDDAMQIDQPRRARGPPLPSQDQRFRSHYSGPPAHSSLHPPASSSALSNPPPSTHRPAPINTTITNSPGPTTTPMTAPPSGPRSASTRASVPSSAINTPNPVVAAAYGRRAGVIPSGPRHHQLQQQAPAKEVSPPEFATSGSGKLPPTGPRTANVGDNQVPKGPRAMGNGSTGFSGALPGARGGRKARQSAGRRGGRGQFQDQPKQRPPHAPNRDAQDAEMSGDHSRRSDFSREKAERQRARDRGHAQKRPTTQLDVPPQYENATRYTNVSDGQDSRSVDSRRDEEIVVESRRRDHDDRNEDNERVPELNDQDYPQENYLGRPHDDADLDVQEFHYDRDESRGRRSSRSPPRSQSRSISHHSRGDGMEVDSRSMSRSEQQVYYASRSPSLPGRSRSYEPQDRSRSPYHREAPQSHSEPEPEPRYRSQSLSHSDHGRPFTPDKGYTPVSPRPIYHEEDEEFNMRGERGDEFSFSRLEEEPTRDLLPQVAEKLTLEEQGPIARENNVQELQENVGRPRVGRSPKVIRRQSFVDRSQQGGSVILSPPPTTLSPPQVGRQGRKSRFGPPGSQESGNSAELSIDAPIVSPQSEHLQLSPVNSLFDRGLTSGQSNQNQRGSTTPGRGKHQRRTSWAGTRTAEMLANAIHQAEQSSPPPRIASSSGRPNNRTPTAQEPKSTLFERIHAPSSTQTSPVNTSNQPSQLPARPNIPRMMSLKERMDGEKTNGGGGNGGGPSGGKRGRRNNRR